MRARNRALPAARNCQGHYGHDRCQRGPPLGPNCPELIEVLYSCARLGAIFVPLNARMPAAELRVFAGQSRPRLLVAEQSFRDVAMAIAPQVAAIFRIGSGDLLTTGASRLIPGGIRLLLS